MVAPKALVFRPLVQGNEDSGNDLEWAKVISTDDEKVIKLSDEDFYLQKDSDSLSEDEENDWDDFESEGCQDNFSVLVDSRVMLTKLGRSVRRPVCLDLWSLFEMEMARQDAI